MQVPVIPGSFTRFYLSSPTPSNSFLSLRFQYICFGSIPRVAASPSCLGMHLVNETPGLVFRRILSHWQHLLCCSKKWVNLKTLHLHLIYSKCNRGKDWSSRRGFACILGPISTGEPLFFHSFQTALFLSYKIQSYTLLAFSSQFQNCCRERTHKILLYSSTSCAKDRSVILFRTQSHLVKVPCNAN